MTAAAQALLCLALAAAAVPSARAQGQLASPTLPYDLLFEATLVPTERLARVRLRMGPNQVDRMVFRIDPERHMNVRGDGKVVFEGTSATWEPPRIGGSLRYDFRVDALRGAAAYDARFPARAPRRDRWGKEIEKKAQEIARYVLPVATCAFLYHTSALTILRYWRMCGQHDVPYEQRLVVGRMVDGLLRVDPEYRRLLEDPLPPAGHFGVA